MKHCSRGILLSLFIHFQVIFIFQQGSAALHANDSLKMTCYYTWNRQKGSLLPDRLDVTLCTHIILGFANVVNATLVPTKPHDIDFYLWTTSLKSKNPGLKIMLSAGGGSGISKAVKSATNREMFINSILKLLKECHFDGFDLDWEFPAWGGSSVFDKPRLVYFLRDFKDVLSKRNLTYLLSVAVAAPKTIIDVSYDVPGIAKYVDFVNLMSYDYHDYGWYLPFTGHNSPLFKRKIEKAYFATLNTAWSADYWVSKGMPEAKLMIGIPTYSHNYKLALPSLHGFDAPAVGSNGEYSYDQTCKFLKSGATRVFDEESQVPYAYKGLMWVGYDDYQSVAAKAHWIKKMGFGGAMTFSLNADDWKGTCDGNTFPLHKTIRDILL